MDDWQKCYCNTKLCILNQWGSARYNTATQLQHWFMINITMVDHLHIISGQRTMNYLMGDNPWDLAI